MTRSIDGIFELGHIDLNGALVSRARSASSDPPWRSSSSNSSFEMNTTFGRGQAIGDRAALAACAIARRSNQHVQPAQLIAEMSGIVLVGQSGTLLRHPPGHRAAPASARVARSKLAPIARPCQQEGIWSSPPLSRQAKLTTAPRTAGRVARLSAISLILLNAGRSHKLRSADAGRDTGTHKRQRVAQPSSAVIAMAGLRSDESGGGNAWRWAFGLERCFRTSTAP